MKKRSTVDTSKSLLAPMPGLLVSLAVEVGDSVAEGDEIAVVEAMKMQNVLKAEKAQVIKSIAAAPGDSLKVGETIVEFA
jgi:propionyl-CoA carboxylase alpha chain